MTKHLTLAEDGSLVKASSECWFAAGLVESASISLRDLATATLPGLEPNEALILSNRDHGDDLVPLASKRKAGPGDLTRTRKDMQYEPAQPALLLIDIDTGARSVEQAIADLSGFIPGFEDCARVVVHSTSSHVSTTDGTPLTEGGSYHVYVLIADAGPLTDKATLKALRDRLLARAWLGGHGHIFVDKSGRQHVRCILDLSVVAPEHVAFEAAPILGDGLVQNRPAPVWTDGTWLDLDALLEPLTWEEQQRYHQLVAEAKDAARPEAERARSKYVRTEARKLKEHGLSQRQAERAVEQRIDGGVVAGEEILFLNDWPEGLDWPEDILGEKPTAAPFEVPVWFAIAFASVLDETYCADPAEPDYGAAPGSVCTTKARLHLDDDGVAIWSFAHGGRKFELRHSAETVRQHLKLLDELDPDVLREDWPGIVAHARLDDDEIDQLIPWMQGLAALENVGKKTLRDKLKSAGAFVRSERREAELDLGQTPEATDANPWPPAYAMTRDGLVFVPEDQWLCGPLEVLAEARDDHGRGWGPMLRWRDGDGRVHEEVLPRSTLVGDGTEALRILADGGLRIEGGRAAANLLRIALAGVEVTTRALNCTTPGWHGDAYLWGPNVIRGTEDNRETLVWKGRRGAHAAYSAGTLEEWQEQIARLAVGNSRLVLAIGIALAGPLLRWYPAGKGGIHIFSSSSVGKSTAAEVGGSALGGFPKPNPGHQGWLSGWNSTAVGLEGAALRHHHSTLIMDEMGAFSGTPQQAAGIVYELSNGLTKGRGQVDGTDRARSTFDLMVLSTGEVTLADMMAGDRNGGAVTGGVQVRLMNLPAEPSRSKSETVHGGFEDLHGWVNGKAFADHLLSTARRCYGTALPAFVAALSAMDEKDIARHIRDAVERLHRVVCKTWGIETVPPQIARMLDRLAVIMAAGTLATEAGILPWPKMEARHALSQITQEWLDDRGSIEAGEQMTILDHVRRTLFTEQSRFVKVTTDAGDALRLDDRPVQRQLGYRMDGDYFIPPEVFNKEFVPPGMNGGTARKQLAAAGVLVVESGPDQKVRYTVRPYLPDADGNVKRLRLVHIRGSILHEASGTGDDDDDDAPAGGPAAPARKTDTQRKLADAAGRL